MTINLNEDVIEKSVFSIDEVLTVLCINNNVDFYATRNKLIARGYVNVNEDSEGNKSYSLHPAAINSLNSIILDSDKNIPEKDKITKLGEALMNIYPKGKKEGTIYYWRDSITNIVKRLQIFFKRYGNSYTDEQIINATKKYVESFNGDYRYMQLLKYFIFKDKRGLEVVENQSELASYLQNEGQEDTLSNNWINDIVYGGE